MHRTVWKTATLVAAFLSATPLAAQTTESALQIFGSINAAYGRSDRIPVLGLNTKGTTDYRVVALQVRYSLTDKDQFVTQLLSRRLGTSLVNQVSGNFSPVWAYYRRKLDDNTTLKLGRNPLPRGLFNETRFIGTILPMYRVAPYLYGETLEFIDGFVATRSQNLPGGFGLEANIFGGGFTYTDAVPNQTGRLSLVQSRNENTLGTQLWLKTPIKGVRFGAFGARYEGAASSKPDNTQMFSAEGDFGRVFVRSEYTSFNRLSRGTSPETNYIAWYAQAGVRPTDKLSITFEHEQADNEVPVGRPTPYKYQAVNANAIGIAYAVTAAAVIKFEMHKQEGFVWDRDGLPFRFTPPATITPLTPDKTYYGLASIAITF